MPPSGQGRLRDALQTDLGLQAGHLLMMEGDSPGGYERAYGQYRRSTRRVPEEIAEEGWDRGVQGRQVGERLGRLPWMRAVRDEDVPCGSGLATSYRAVVTIYYTDEDTGRVYHRTEVIESDERIRRIDLEAAVDAAVDRQIREGPRVGSPDLPVTIYYTGHTIDQLQRRC